MTFQGENSSLTWFFPALRRLFSTFFFFLGGFVLEPVHWPRALPCTCAVLCSKYRTNLWGWKPSQHLSLPTFLWENELRRSNIKFRFSPKTFTHELECLGSLLLRLDFLPLVTIFLLFRGQYYKNSPKSWNYSWWPRWIYTVEPYFPQRTFLIIGNIRPIIFDDWFS